MADYVQTGEVPPAKPELAGPQDINLNYEAGGAVPVVGRSSREGLDASKISMGPGQMNPMEMLSSAPGHHHHQPMADPMVLQAYAHTMPAAGLPARQVHEQCYVSPTAGRQYKMASDIFGTGMDRSWSSQPNEPSAGWHGAPHRDGNEPTSFKITETTNKSPPLPTTTAHEFQAEPAANSASNRRTRESAGNPLTGLGYDSTNTKTAKRYFEGSNANQKLW